LMRAVLIGAIVSVILNILFIPSLESLGAVYSILITELIITFLTLLAVRKVVVIKVNYKSIILYLFLALVLIPICNLLNVYFDGIFYLILTSIMCLLIYTSGLFLFGDEFFKENILKPIFKKMK